MVRAWQPGGSLSTAWHCHGLACDPGMGQAGAAAEYEYTVLSGILVLWYCIRWIEETAMKPSTSQEIKQALWELLDQLPPSQRHQVLDFARFLHQPALAPPPELGETADLAPSPEQKIQLRLVSANS